MPTTGRRSSSQTKPEAAGISPELDELWHRFKESAAQDAREQLIVHYSPLVKYVASRVATGLPANVEQADLVSYGIFGLIDALEKFDLAREIKFETYAIPRIRGAIIDELRSLDWVPRSVRFKAREVEKAYSELEARLKRAPSDKEVAEHLGVSLAELHDIVTQISFVTVTALEEVVSSGGDRGESISLLDTLADVAAIRSQPRPRRKRDKGHAVVGNQRPLRAGEDRHYPLLFRGADASGDRRRPRRDRIARVPDPHESGGAAPRQPQGHRNGLSALSAACDGSHSAGLRSDLA